MESFRSKKRRERGRARKKRRPRPNTKRALLARGNGKRTEQELRLPKKITKVINTHSVRLYFGSATVGLRQQPPASFSFGTGKCACRWLKCAILTNEDAALAAPPRTGVQGALAFCCSIRRRSHSASSLRRLSECSSSAPARFFCDSSTRRLFSARMFSRSIRDCCAFSCSERNSSTSLFLRRAISEMSPCKRP